MHRAVPYHARLGAAALSPCHPTPVKACPSLSRVARARVTYNKKDELESKLPRNTRPASREPEPRLSGLTLWRNPEHSIELLGGAAHHDDARTGRISVSYTLGSLPAQHPAGGQTSALRRFSHGVHTRTSHSGEPPSTLSCCWASQRFTTTFASAIPIQSSHSGETPGSASACWATQRTITTLAPAAHIKISVFAEASGTASGCWATQRFATTSSRCESSMEELSSRRSNT